MSSRKVFLIGTLLLFSAISGMALLKKKSSVPSSSPSQESVEEVVVQLEEVKQAPIEQPALPPVIALSSEEEAIDRIPQLFALDSTKLPFVETISYTSRVPWLKGRPAWIADYASHYATSRHFIARSLNRRPDYLTQKVSPGDRFNVFKLGAKIHFHLVIDLSRCRMWFYVVNLDSNERTLLKVYRVGVGRMDATTPSGFLTPVGTYHLGDKIAIYKPGVMGFFQNQKVEMIRIFGTRWIPFDREIEGCSQSAQGLGLHGAPWIADSRSGELLEDRSKIGSHESDGCIRLASEDIEELFAIIITKETTVELVRDFHDAKLDISGVDYDYPRSA